MKNILLIALLYCYCVNAQENGITAEQAIQYLATADEVTITDVDESSEAYAVVNNGTPGDIFINGNIIYQIITIKNRLYFNTGYIYLDGSKLSMDKINKLRTKILNEFKTGVPFRELVKKYNMDGSQDADQLVFTDGEMVPEFEDAVKKSVCGVPFTVDVPYNKWYYVAIKNSLINKIVYEVAKVEYR